MIRSLLRWPFFIFVIAMLFGCAASPNVSFYTLDKPHYPEARSENSSRLDILLGPLTVPEMVDRPQFVVRTGDNMVDIIDTRRWAQPLKIELAHALAANLAQDLGTLRVFLAGQSMAGEPDIRVSVDILRFESWSGAEATIEARWTIQRKESKTTLTGRSIARETLRGEGYDILVAAHGRALARIGHEIADAIRAGLN